MTTLQHVLDNWVFKACDGEKWFPATVRGCVHTDLLKNGQIDDPYYGTNEHELQWIDKKDWEYRTSIELPEGWSDLSRIDIVFDGLDTYADVIVNGQLALTADNMFHSWSADIKSLLTEGTNTITVKFRSPISEDMPKLESLGYQLPAPNDQSELGGTDDRKISVFARKAPYHYGWDWGPRFVTSGIWREVRLEGWSEPVIRDLFIRQDQVNAEMAQLTAIVEVDSIDAWEGRLQIASDCGQLWSEEIALESGKQSITLNMQIADPKLWWCRGLGEPTMYSFNAELLQGELRVADYAVKTGLRQIRLVREPDKAGASFYFELNGVPVFARGSNHIPNDSFAAKVTYERYRHEIASAAESNMNMLRVWGGGIYEEDIFYELCDEYGLLVWQDFMFACSMYPGDEAFLNSVSKEAEYNIRRLRNHPCIALWCGNNEIDSAWSQYLENAGWGWKEKGPYTSEIRDRIWHDYQAVFHNILPKAVADGANGVAYWPSSPLRDLTGDEKQHAYKIFGEGDVHYWGVWHASEPFNNYNTQIGRFMSEYGFQSFPELDSVLRYAPESELALESEVMLAHQKNGRGNQLIKQYMDMYLPEPKDFKSFLYLSQILQAEAIKTAIEAHRRNKPYCMGTLYWQMNDCWPVASWAGIDYYGRWKALQYTVRRSFKDVMLSIDDSDNAGEIAVHIVSDRPVGDIEAELILALYDFKGTLLQEQSYQILVAANSSSRVFMAQTKELLGDQDPRNVVMRLVLQCHDEVLDSKEHYFTSFKDMKLTHAQVSVEEVTGSAGTVLILESNELARQVWLSSEEEGIFSDNFFDLIPGIPVTVDFRLRSDGEEAFVPGSPGKIMVRSMVDFVKSEE